MMAELNSATDTAGEEEERIVMLVNDKKDLEEQLKEMEDRYVADILPHVKLYLYCTKLVK